MIAIIDYGGGNSGSILHALQYLKQSTILTADSDIIHAATRIILPGVGQFGNVMQQILDRQLRDPLARVWVAGIPILGICIGMQIMFEQSEETPGIPGLGWISGGVIRYQIGKVPQIGWNLLEKCKSPLFHSSHMYFVNSYYAFPTDSSIIVAESTYYQPFAAAIQHGNLTGVQFHPEKSGQEGLAFLARWCKC